MSVEKRFKKQKIEKKFKYKCKESYINCIESFRGLKDVKYIVYQLIWKWKMKQLKKELYNLMEYKNGDGWVSNRTGEYLFQFRDLNTHDDYMFTQNTNIFKVMGCIGKTIDHTLSSVDCVCELPDNYYTHYNKSDLV